VLTMCTAFQCLLQILSVIFILKEELQETYIANVNCNHSCQLLNIHHGHKFPVTFLAQSLLGKKPFDISSNIFKCWLLLFSLIWIFFNKDTILYNKPSYSHILIGSRLWSIRGQTHDWCHHHKVFPSAF